MPAGHDVRPGKWSEVIDLFDNGVYSAVWGYYGGDRSSRCLGVRWNADEGGIGYPNQGANPLWYVEPRFLAEPILISMLTIVQQQGLADRRYQEYERNIRAALNELRQP
jgi:hypothetical protein